MAQFLHTIDAEKAGTDIMELDDAAVESLYGFGALLFGEVQQRSSQLDSKLTMILGWASAMLAFLTLDLGVRSVGVGVGHTGLTATSAMFAFSALIVAALGLKATDWIIPSEADWFREGILEHPTILRRYHVISLLEAHQDQNRENGRKAQFLVKSERLLIASAVSLAAIMAWRVILAFSS